MDNKWIQTEMELDEVYVDVDSQDFEALGMRNLEICFNSAKATGAKFVGVLIEMGGISKPEVIINPYENFDSKLAYYKNAYDEKLNHKFANDVKIVGFTSANSFHEVQFFLSDK